MKLLFDLPNRQSKEEVAKLAKKVNKRIKDTTYKKPTLMQTMEQIRIRVEQSIGKYKDKYKWVNDKEYLKEYINHCVNNNIVTVDTETTGLDAIEDVVVGIGLHTPNQPSIYIPLRHIDAYTKQLSKNQLTYEDIVEVFVPLLDIPSVWHNSKFDTKIIYNSIGIQFTNVFWDTLPAAHLLNENESHRLKDLHNKYVAKGELDEVFQFSDLFEDINFSEIPIDVGYIYGARDPEITYELFKYQEQFLGYHNYENKTKYANLAYAYKHIELPIYSVAAEVEQNGVAIDNDRAEELYKEYKGYLDEARQHFIDTLKPYEKQILEYNSLHFGVLENPINYASPTQLAVLLYDILKVGVIDNKKPRGTGEEILSQIDLPVAEAILECRGYEKLIGTYIEKLPKAVKSKTGRIHCSFNPCGADTGRFSSSDPNLQNIPAKNKDIRKMFTASDGYVLLSSDFSQQEPRILTFLTQDEGLLRVYAEGKDLYAWAASMVYKVPYEECKEFRPDGTLNPDGKKRRSALKAIILGIMYSKGVKAISEDLHITTREAENLYNTFFKSFPKVKQFIDDTQTFARTNGYVETIWGRKRRLPDILLPKYDFVIDEKYIPDFNPMEFKNQDYELYIDEDTKGYYTNLLEKAKWYTQKMSIIERARQNGIIIIDNTMKIAGAERQCVNAIIQGSAAQQTKIAMIKLNKNEEFRQLGGRILLTVHDEIIAEAPYENRVRCGEIMSETMSNSVKDTITNVAFKCDVEITKVWYGEGVA